MKTQKPTTQHNSKLLLPHNKIRWGRSLRLGTSLRSACKAERSPQDVGFLADGFRSEVFTPVESEWSGVSPRRSSETKPVIRTQPTLICIRYVRATQV